MATVRPATDDDRPTLRAIQAATLAEPSPALLDLAVGDGGPRLRVIDAGEPVGYVLAVTAAHPVAYVAELAVTPAHQGSGFGARLLEALIAELAEEGFERVRLTTRVGDERVRRFYRERGFEPVDRVADHFEAGDGVVLERSIGEGT